jgi:hypothetical protein
MPKGPQGQKRPADTVANAIRVAQILTGEIEEDMATESLHNKLRLCLPLGTPDRLSEPPRAWPERSPASPGLRQCSGQRNRSRPTPIGSDRVDDVSTGGVFISVPKAEISRRDR